MKRMNSTQLLACVLGVFVLIAIIGLVVSPGSSEDPIQQDGDGWQVRSVGGMALDEQNSNLYLTSTAVLKNATSTETRCLIRMVSFSPEEGFASANNRSTFPKGGSNDWLHDHEPSDLVCPGDPRCVVRRQLVEDFEEVDEGLYPEKCTKIYIRENQTVILGRVTLRGAARGSVIVMPLNPNKIGDGNKTQEFRPREEPMAAAFHGNDTIYLVSHPHSYSSSIVLSRYSNKDGNSWKKDFRDVDFLVSDPSHRIHVSSLDAILGGQYLLFAGTIFQGSGQSVEHFGVYHAHNQSKVEGLEDSSAIVEQDQNAKKHTIECVSLDEHNSNASIAILYRVSTFVANNIPISIVKKLHLERDEHGVLRQTTIWTQELIRASMKKCHLANHALVLAGFTHTDESSEPVLTVSKHFATNGHLLWTTKQEDPALTGTDSDIHLADVTMDKQSNVLVYGQNRWDVSDDIVLLQALHGMSGNMLSSSNSPLMHVKKSITSGGRSSIQKPRSFHVVSREELMSNYQVPMIILIVGLVVSLLLGICVACTHRANEQEKEKETFRQRIMNVFSYLRPFQANEVDLQQSPTGGFNATYTDDLIKNTESTAETETSLSTRL